MFKDKAGRDWSLDLTKGDLRRVEKTGVPLGKLLGDMPRLAKELLSDSDKFFGVVWCLVESQAKAAGLTKEDLEDGWDGQTEEDAGLAFVDAVVDFSPARKVASKVKESFRAMEAKGKELAGAKLSEATAEALEMMSQQITDLTFTNSAANSPPSPELTATG